MFDRLAKRISTQCDRSQCCDLLILAVVGHALIRGLRGGFQKAYGRPAACFNEFTHVYFQNVSATVAKRWQ